MRVKIKKHLHNLLSLFYPQSCVACGNTLQQNEHSLCLECMLHLPETHYHQEIDNPLQLLFRGRVQVENIASLLFFKKGNQVQKILHSLKYNGNQQIGEYLGYYYGKQLAKEAHFQEIDCILPVPLHPKKMKLRGYNQSECIAKGLSKAMGIPYCTDILVRTTFTDTQTKKTRFNRWTNVEHVFAANNPEQITGKHFLICDDVLTTGATLEAAISKLKNAGNPKISIVTLAVAN